MGGCIFKTQPMKHHLNALTILQLTIVTLKGRMIFHLPIGFGCLKKCL